MISRQKIAVLRCDGPSRDEPGKCTERYTEVLPWWAEAECPDQAEERIRHVAKQAGWTRSALWPGGPLYDLCPSCAQSTHHPRGTDP